MARVELVSLLQIVAGLKCVDVEIPQEGTSVIRLLESVIRVVPELRDYIMDQGTYPNLQSRIAVVVNGEIVTADSRVYDGDSVILMVPSTGG